VREAATIPLWDAATVVKDYQLQQGGEPSYRDVRTYAVA